MMIISDSNGNFLKNLVAPETEVYGLHEKFGIITERLSNEREHMRKRRGLVNIENPWKLKFRFKKRGNKLIPVGLENGMIQDLGDGSWLVSNGSVAFQVIEAGTHEDEITLPYHHQIEEEADKVFNRSLLSAFLLLLLMVSGLLWLRAQPEEEEEKKLEEPITVTVIEKPKAVQIPRPKIMKKPKPLTKKQKAHRAVKQNLGFLGLVGNQNLKKAVGGATTNLKNSAGVGNGQEGSGGELLVGLGKGVKKTTVGNTGVTGLGGIGTKGRGGGKGGYGTTSVASGEGSGLSSIPISNDMVLDGGLDAYVVQATIAKYLNQVRACYEKGLQKNPALAGKVTVAFQVNGNGGVDFSRVKSSSLGNTQVEQCITKKMVNWIFPKPRGGVKVPITYPFILRPVRS
ncbi:MAG: AgmX/PglI C-terminal domain-containing protein [Bacteriovoracaceae bacterium]